MEVIAAGASWVLNKAPSPQKMLGNIGLVSLAAWSDLSAKLSPNASITLPNDDNFGGLISRWRDWHAPQVGAIVATFTEADVQETVSGQVSFATLADSDRFGMRTRTGYHSSRARVVMVRLRHCSLPKMPLSSIFAA